MHDLYKTDLFTLGMIVLETCTLETCEDLYNYESGYIIQEELDNRLEYAATQYSKNVIHLIKEMLIFEENERPSAE